MLQEETTPLEQIEKGKARISFELDGEKVKAEIQGKGSDLVDLCCNAMNKNPNIRIMFELSVMTMKRFDVEQGKEDGMNDIEEALLMALLGGKEGMS